ncbi:hypothetical protein UPYG_G00005910 [Umbra pygmaea]|uniref:Uncharacterized protein n=1 Tax=Umbra pygmaea TaxID=75934 RepID=A0ABD0Y4T8_UMBPY
MYTSPLHCSSLLIRWIERAAPHLPTCLSVCLHNIKLGARVLDLPEASNPTQNPDKLLLEEEVHFPFWISQISSGCPIGDCLTFPRPIG